MVLLVVTLDRNYFNCDSEIQHRHFIMILLFLCNIFYDIKYLLDTVLTYYSISLHQYNHTITYITQYIYMPDTYDYMNTIGRGKLISFINVCTHSSIPTECGSEAGLVLVTRHRGLI